MKNNSIIFGVITLALSVQLSACSKKQIPETDQPPQTVLEMDYDKLWKEIDSLDRKQLYRSAQEKVIALSDLAHDNNASVQWIKAQIYLSKYAYHLSEDDLEAAILGMDIAIAGSSGAERAVLYSLAGELYKKYFQQYGYKIRQRTDTGDPTPDDIKTWTVNDLIEKSTAYYLKSLDDQSIRNIPVAEYDQLLTEYNTAEITTTLFDILAHRAINYFNENLWSLTDFRDHESLNDITYLAPYKEFVTVEIEITDGHSDKSRALKIMQELIRFHMHDSLPDALVHADLKRLGFVYQNLQSESKELHYLQALKSLFAQFSSHAASAEIAFYIATWYHQHAGQFDQGNEEARWDLKKAVEICQEAIDAFPKSYGAAKCANLESILLYKDLRIETERVWIPGEHHLLNIGYKNIDTAFVRVIPVDVNDGFKFEQLRGDRGANLASLEPLEEYRFSLRSIEDLRSHSIEVGIKPLPAGSYVLLISDAQSFDQYSQLAYTMMSVSQIAFWQEQQPNESLTDDINVLEGYSSAHYSRFVVVDRKSGAPIPGALVELYTLVYQRDARQQELVYLSRGTTDENGVIDNLNTKNNSRLIPKITIGNDVLFLTGGYHAQVKNKPSPGRNQAFLFTDRAIYRPGQIIHFKGYLLNFNKDKIPSILTNKSVTVDFKNVNGKSIDTLKLRSNSFGTFSGTMRAPASGLTGRMTLVCENYGRVSVQVEEYKRPQFEVTVDAPETPSKLGEKVAVSGKAAMYSGVPVSNAKIAYTIARQVYFPYWLWRRSGFGPYPGTNQKIIATGESSTDANGKFIIEFISEEIEGLPVRYNPEYRYSVDVDVTDQAGETQSSTRAIRLNNTGFVVDLILGEEIDISEAPFIPAHVKTLNGQPVDATITVRSQRLKSPDGFMRKRLWGTPEFTSISIEDYKNDFTLYASPLFEAMEDWEVVNSYKPQTFENSLGDTLNLSSIMDRVGVYKLSVSVKSIGGDTLNIVRYVTCNDAERQEFAAKGQVHFQGNQKSYQPSESLEHSFTTDIPVHLRYRIGKTNQLIAQWYHMTDTLTRSTEITEADRGGFATQYIYVYEGRFFSENVAVSVPWTNKDLKIDFLSYRDHTLPGAEEEWRIKISGSEKDPVVAEMLATMYDASLDAFIKHNWNLNLFPINNSPLVVSQLSFVNSYSRYLHQRSREPQQNFVARKFADLKWFGFPGIYVMDHFRGSAVPMSAPANADGVEVESRDISEADDGAALSKEAATPEIFEENVDETVQTDIRTNLKETVFFIPHALVDEEGNITLRFKMNEALTRWKFMSIFHTPDLEYAVAQKEVVTQKELMVMPHVPRFLRQKDTVSLSTRVYNNSDKTIRGTVMLNLLDAISGRSLVSLIPSGGNSESLVIEPDSTKIFSWQVIVPDDLITPIRYQFIARGDAVGDGEEGIIPVVTDRIFVTESKVLFTPAESTRVFKFGQLDTKRSDSFEPFKLTLEYTSNPAWYAVQALPYLQEYPHQCVEQQFNRMYANALGGHIIGQFPEIRRVFETWQDQDSEGLRSNLSRNQELKSLMLEETPWLRDAESEEEQMRNISSLFDAFKLSDETSSSLRTLAEAQMSNGGFPWFPGGRDNWYITQYVVEGLGRLSRLGVLDDDMRQEIQPVLISAVNYLDQRLVETYQKLSERVGRGETTFEENHISNLISHYLYTRSFFPDIIAEGGNWSMVFNYYTHQAETYWSEQSLYGQSLIAIALHRDGNHVEEVATIQQSFEERSLYEEDRGRFWKSGSGWYWHEAPIERHATMIEFFAEVNADQKFIDELRQYLLMHKQTNRWSTTKSTSAAIYALLLQGGNWLDGEPVIISAGQKDIPVDDPIAGSLYFKKTWDGDAIEDFASDLTVSNPNKHVSWGGMYLQYFEDLDDVKSDAGEQLQVRKSLYTVDLSDDKRTLVAIDPGAELKLGTELVVRIEIRTDRDLEFVHLKDMRASALEPVSVISRYKYQDGLGYYESTSDMATNFFFDRMRRGTYVFEYPLRVSHTGSFSNGVATLQCMYAPEFAGHSKSERLMIGK